ncbi:MAG: mechanosensitive ion channel family protein [Bacilli bacterium]|nr:mechanosensitive ion channel family protein [Bacilli bacterium]
MEEPIKKEPEKKEEKKVGFWKSRTTKEKVYFVLGVSFFFLFIFLIFTLIFPRQFYGDDLANIFLDPSMPNAIPLFANFGMTFGIKIIATLLVIAVMFVIVFIINFLINFFTYSKTNKTRTLSSLVRSCIRYIAVILIIAITLTIWGVDVGSVVASLGVLTLIVGLGCQSLIQDVVSGLFIVFDNYYSVGDTVIIDGFRGDVYEIGLRSTKVKDFASNIKCINNSNVGTMINLSAAGNSAAFSRINIGFNEDLRHVESVIHKGLPEIKKKIPKIVGNIEYLGVDSFDECGLMLLFLAYVKEGDRFAVQRDLNREIYLLMVDNDITIPFRQIAINQADDPNKPRATEEEKASLEKIVTKARALPENTKKKRNIGHKFKESLNETVKQMEDEAKD